MEMKKEIKKMVKSALFTVKSRTRQTVCFRIHGGGGGGEKKKKKDFG
jgi:hypothetical protein